MRRALLLVDGEHHPPVIEAGLRRLSASGYEPVAAIFLGGFEKAGGPPPLPIPVQVGDPFTLIPRIVSDLAIEVVVDLSDEPVLDHRGRFRLVSAALAAGAAYEGGGFAFAPPPRPRLTTVPTVEVTGTGKRTGKTAVTIELARHWRRMGRRPCIVTMGRGGPPEPIVLSGSQAEDPLALFDRLVGDGLHATSDYVEDAVFAGVDTVGTRRLGAGPAGVTVDDTFADGVEAALSLDPDLVLYEGSGTAVPPAAVDASVLVSRGDLDPEYLIGYLGPFRLALASAFVVVGPVDGLARALEGRPAPPVFRAELVPETTVDVAGRDVVLVTTAPESALPAVTRALLARDAASVEAVATLSDRRRLADDLSRLRPGQLVLTEVKAAAADIVIPTARRAGAEVGLVHNRAEMEPGIGELAGLIEETWASAGEVQALTS